LRRVADLQRLYDYSYWANRKLFLVMQQLTPEQFVQPVAGSYGSIRNTLVHSLRAEWGWLDRAGGPARGPKLDAEKYPTLESLVAEWRKVEGYLRGFLAGQSDASLARVVEFSFDGVTRYSLTVGEMLQHAAVHGAHHRGQVALLLRMLGVVPGNFDLLFYCAETRNNG